MRKIIVTGAAGFIGSHLVEWCVEKGYQTRALVRYNSRNQWGWLETSAYLKEVEVVTGDIRDYDSVHKALSECDTVFHLAALIGIPYSYVSPVAYVKTNVEGTYNVLQASRDLGLENVLVTSTSEVYGTAQYVPIDENHPLVGQSPYSASKIAADQLAISYFRSFGLPVTIVRPFNTYGPRQSARAVIPTIALQILSGQTRLHLGNIHPTRDLTFVKDTVRAYVSIAESNELKGQVVNIGRKHEISVKDLAHLIGKVLNVSVEIVREDERLRPPASEVERLVCENAKILKTTNWRPEVALEVGIAETVAWLRTNMHLYKSTMYNV